MLANGEAQMTTARLTEAMAAGMRRHNHAVTVVLRPFPPGVLAKLRTMARTEVRNARRVARADVLIVHTSLSLSLVPMAVARALRRPVVAMVWDIYPHSSRLRGNIKAPLLLWMYALTERLGYRLASTLVLLSEDYRVAIHSRKSHIRVLPPWPCDPIRPIEPARSSHDGVLRLGFAGQINEIRGIDRGLERLLRNWTGDRIELHIFSRDSSPDKLTRLVDSNPAVEVVEHGFVTPDVLQAELQRLDLGWVCLDPEFSLPAFPSKTITYLAAGVPILYSGPPMPALEEWLTSNGLGLTAPETGLSPAAVDQLTCGYAARRSAYLSRMEDEWFDLGRLL